MISSFSKFSVLDAIPLASGSADGDDKKVFALEVRIKHKQKAVIWLGPLTGLQISQERKLKRFLRRNFSGNAKNGYTKVVWGKTNKHLLKRVQRYLVGIKKGFPHEHKVVVSFVDKIKYQVMINSMGAMRSIAAEDKAFQITNLVSQKEKTRVLFPQVVFSEGK